MRVKGIGLVAAAVVAVGGVPVVAASSAQAASAPRCNSVVWLPAGVPAPAYNHRRDVGCYVPYGSSGSIVRALQEWTSTVGVTNVLRIDGSYGPATKAAVATWQRDWNACHRGSPQLTVDGLYGPRTALMALTGWAGCGD